MNKMIIPLSCLEWYPLKFQQSLKNFVPIPQLPTNNEKLKEQFGNKFRKNTATYI